MGLSESIGVDIDLKTGFLGFLVVISDNTLYMKNACSDTLCGDVLYFDYSALQPHLGVTF